MWPSYHIEQLHAPFRPWLHVHFRINTENDISLCVSTDEFEFHIRFPHDIHCKSGDNNWKKRRKTVPRAYGSCCFGLISHTTHQIYENITSIAFFFLFCISKYNFGFVSSWIVFFVFFFALFKWAIIETLEKLLFNLRQNQTNVLICLSTKIDKLEGKKKPRRRVFKWIMWHKTGNIDKCFF